MFENITGIQSSQGLQGLQPYSSEMPVVDPKGKTKEEFLALFYKEILKQVFKPPELGGFGDEQSPSFNQVFGSDLLVEKLALELARSGSFSAGDIFPESSVNSHTNGLGVGIQ